MDFKLCWGDKNEQLLKIIKTQEENKKLEVKGAINIKVG